MYDLDEGLGAVTYDRSKFAEDADGWNHNNGQLMKQMRWAMNTPKSLLLLATCITPPFPTTSPKPYNWALSSEINGTYIVPNVKYQGASRCLMSRPTSPRRISAHLPTGNAGCLGRRRHAASENRDFTDVSAFEVDIDVVYQDIPEGASDYSGIVTPIASDCPVKGVRFKVDGVVAKDENETP